MRHKTRRWVLLLIFATLCDPSSYAQAQSVGTARTLITEPIDPTHLVVLKGNVRPEAVPANDLGRVSDKFPMSHIFLLMRRSPERQKSFEFRLKQVTDRRSGLFHQWLTAEQIGDQFGPAPNDVRTVTAWLQSHGFHINRVYQSLLIIDISGNAGQVRRVFHTEIHMYISHGRHFANASDPQIPAALASAVDGIVSLHNFPVVPAYTFTSQRNCKLSNETCYFLVPADLWKIYNFNPLFNQKNEIAGNGQTIAVVEDSDMSDADRTAFRSAFGLASFAGTFETIHPGSCTPPGSDNIDAVEATLDVEWAGAAAPDAKVLLASCSSFLIVTNGVLVALDNLINSANPPSIISISYTTCESTAGADFNKHLGASLSQAAMENISVYVAAGDSGSANCDNPNIQDAANRGIAVNAWASTPYAVAVGGTDFGDTYDKKNSKYWSGPSDVPPYGSALSYVPEIPWNSSCASTLIAKFVTGKHNERTYGKNGFCNTNQDYLSISAGGGGPSNCVYRDTFGHCIGGWPKPYGQAGIAGNPNDGVRDLPDVSLFSAGSPWSHKFIFCYSDTKHGGAACTGEPSSWIKGGGTSFAAPIWAGIQALLNQALNAPQGDPLPFLYGYAISTFEDSEFCYSQKIQGQPSGCMFYDVTEGDTDVDCSWAIFTNLWNTDCFQKTGTIGVLSTSKTAYQPAFAATPTWDFATGIGTPNVANLVNAMSARWVIDDEWFQGFGSGRSFDVMLFKGTQVFATDIWCLDRLVSVNGSILNGTHLAGSDNGVEKTWRDLAGAIPGDGTYFVYSTHDAGGGNDGDISIIFLSVQNGVWTYSSYLPSNFPRQKLTGSLPDRK